MPVDLEKENSYWVDKCKLSDHSSKQIFITPALREAYGLDLSVLEQSYVFAEAASKFVPLLSSLVRI